MAEIMLSQKNGRRKVAAPKIDLTPMVDLGFLLITFFMYTTTMAKPRTMELNMPYKGPSSTAFIAESTITLIPVSKHRVVYYYGALRDEGQLLETTFENNAIRNLLLQKKKESAALPVTISKEGHELHVLIKPNANSTYEDLVKVLDEMTIVDAPYYAIVDVNDIEKEWVERKYK